jgi:hypothetical protein
MAILYNFNQACLSKETSFVICSVILLFSSIQIQTIQRLKDERDTTLQQNQQMQRELVSLFFFFFALHFVL